MKIGVFEMKPNQQMKKGSPKAIVHADLEKTDRHWKVKAREMLKQHGYRVVALNEVRDQNMDAVATVAPIDLQVAVSTRKKPMSRAGGPFKVKDGMTMARKARELQRGV